MLTFQEFQQSRVWHENGHDDSGLEGPGWVYATDGGHINADPNYENTGICFLNIENRGWEGKLEEMERILYTEWYTYLEITRERDKVPEKTDAIDHTVSGAIHRCLDDWASGKEFSMEQAWEDMDEIVQNGFESWAEQNGWDYDEEGQYWIKLQDS